MVKAFSASGNAVSPGGSDPTGVGGGVRDEGHIPDDEVVQTAC